MFVFVQFIFSEPEIKSFEARSIWISPLPEKKQSRYPKQRRYPKQGGLSMLEVTIIVLPYGDGCGVLFM